MTCSNWFQLVQSGSNLSKLVQIYFKLVPFFFETHCFDSEKFTFDNKFGNTTSYLFDDLTQTARPKFLYQKNASEPALQPSDRRIEIRLHAPRTYSFVDSTTVTLQRAWGSFVQKSFTCKNSRNGLFYHHFVLSTND